MHLHLHRDEGHSGHLDLVGEGDHPWTIDLVTVIAAVIRRRSSRTLGPVGHSGPNPEEREKMTTQFDDVVKDAKRSAKEQIAEYLKRQNGSSTVIDKLIKAVSDIHENEQLDEPTIQELLVLLSCIERLSDDLLTWARTP